MLPRVAKMRGAAGWAGRRRCRRRRDRAGDARRGAAGLSRARNPFARAVPSNGPRVPVRVARSVWRLRKVACAIRELDTFEGVLEFELGERLGESASSACVRAAACTTVRTPELSRCAVKFIDDRERAENEWFHLTTYRSPLFPAPFLFGRVGSQGADASASLVAGSTPPARRAKVGGRPPPAPPGAFAARLRRSAHLRGALCHRDGAHRGSDARAAHRAGLRRAGRRPWRRRSRSRVPSPRRSRCSRCRSRASFTATSSRRTSSWAAGVQDAPGRSGCLRPRAGSSAAQARGRHARFAR